MVKPLIFFIVGITIYAFFVFKFYKYLAKKDGRIPKDSSLGFIKRILHEKAEAVTAIAKEIVGFAPYKLLEEFNQTALPKE